MRLPLTFTTAALALATTLASSAAMADTNEWARVLSDLDAVLIMACDQPFVESSTVAALIAKQKKTRTPIISSSYADTLGIPALFDRSCFEALLALPDQSGAKALIESRPNDVTQVEFERGALDIDTPADLERLTS